MSATRIMVIRHAEKPGKYDHVELDCAKRSLKSKKTNFNGIEADGTESKESLVTQGWERAGALVTLFTPPHGPLTPHLSEPQYLFAADPCPTAVTKHGETTIKQGSRRPYETITAVAAQLELTVNVDFAKDDYAVMVHEALKCDGVVLIAWQHEDIYWGPVTTPGISRCIIEQTNTPPDAFPIPRQWPSDRYDVVWVFDRDKDSGAVTAFTQVPQQLLHGDKDHGISSE